MGIKQAYEQGRLVFTCSRPDVRPGGALCGQTGKIDIEIALASWGGARRLDQIRARCKPLRIGRFRARARRTAGTPRKARAALAPGSNYSRKKIAGNLSAPSSTGRIMRPVSHTGGFRRAPNLWNVGTSAGAAGAASMKERANAISAIVEEVRWDLHSIGRSERRLHCSRGMKPRGPAEIGLC